MTQPLPSKPNIDYTSRDYLAVRDDLMNLIPSFMPEWVSRSPNDFGIVLLELWAYVADQLNYAIDRVANEAYIDTAVQRENVIRLARMLGYNPAGATAAGVTLTFTNSTGSPITIPALTQVSTVADSAGSTQTIIFETQADLTLGANSTGTVLALQGVTVSNEVVATSTGTIDQSYALFNPNVINGSVQITVNDGTATVWSYVPRIVTAQPGDTVYTLLVDDQSVVTVVFGDNSSGAIPPIGAAITATYRIGGGAIGNVGAGTINQIVSNMSAGMTVNNSSAAVGGADVETTDSIRANAERAASTLQRAVTLADYTDLALLVPGCGAAAAVSNFSTSVTVFIAPDGGAGLDGLGGVVGSPTAAFANLINTVDAALMAASPAGTSVNVLSMSYVPINVTVTAHLTAKARQSTTQSAIAAAIASYLSFANQQFGATLSLDNLYEAMNVVPGVNYTDVAVLSTTSSGTAAIMLQANQFPVLGNLTVNVTGGIAS